MAGRYNKVQVRTKSPVGSAASDHEGGSHGAEHSRTELRLKGIVEPILGLGSAADALPLRIDEFPPETLTLLQQRIETSFGLTIALDKLAGCPTLERLADLLDRAREEASASIVPFQPSGDRTPLFFVHGAGGEVDALVELAASMGLRQPFYGIRPRPQAELGMVSVQQRAADYISSLRIVQPHGPYFLGGYSFGGVVAFEMAHQLIAVGEDVPVVLMLDTYFPSRRLLVPGFRYSGVFDRLDYLIGKFYVHPREERAVWIKQLLGRRLVKLGLAFKKGTYPRDEVDFDCDALEAYDPRPLYRPIVLFWSADCAFRAAQDSRLAWSKVAGVGFEVNQIPGHHATMLKSPNVEILAREMQSCLARIRNR